MAEGPKPPPKDAAERVAFQGFSFGVDFTETLKPTPKAAL